MTSASISAPASESAKRSHSAVSLSGITRRFGHKWALRGIELDVAAGDLVVIQGPNGGGKSTLLRVIATAIAPTGGSGRILGLDLKREASGIRQRTAMLGSSNGHYEDLSARENLRFAARMLGVRHPAAPIAAVLTHVGLSQDADERVRSFSSGMQRRLALGRLLMQDPQLLLLDEPFNALDVDGAALVNELIAGTRQRGGTAIVVLHDLARLTSVPSAGYTMLRGRLT